MKNEIEQLNKSEQNEKQQQENIKKDLEAKIQQARDRINLKKKELGEAKAK